MIVRVFKMKKDATDEQCRALSEKLDYHDKLLDDSNRRKEIVAQFDDELDLVAFMIATSQAQVLVIKDKSNG